MKKITAITRVYGDGEKVVAVEMEQSCFPDQIKLEEITVPDRNITDITVKENIVRIWLDTNDAKASTKQEQKGARGFQVSFAVPEMVVFVKEVKYDVTECRREGINRFTISDYFDERTGNKVSYALFKPGTYEMEEIHSLIVFLGDYMASFGNPVSALAQGEGAVLWTEEEMQKKKSCFVLAPSYEGRIVTDDYKYSTQIEAIANLIEQIKKKYKIDDKEVYGIGQSMGGMALFQMLADYPDLFRRTLHIGAFWKPEVVASIKETKYWSILSEKDEKAFSVMEDIRNRSDGTPWKLECSAIVDGITAAVMDAELADQVKAQKGNRYTIFKGDSVLADRQDHNPMAYHRDAWKKIYRVQSVQNWLLGI